MVRSEKINISGSFYSNKCKYMACECVGVACEYVGMPCALECIGTACESVGVTCERAWPVILNMLSRVKLSYPFVVCHIPYSGKFSRGPIFTVFAVDWQTTKIKPVK